MFCGGNCIERFYENLRCLAQEIYGWNVKTRQSGNQPTEVTPQNLENQTNCCCKITFHDLTDFLERVGVIKMYDHGHLMEISMCCLRQMQFSHD